MTSCRAVIASVAIAETRAGSTAAALRCLEANCSVAERPDPAAVGFGAVGADMWFSLRRCGWVGGLPAGSRRELARGGGQGGPFSAVPAVVRQLVRVDVDADPGSGTDGELAAGDLQRLGEQVVAHVQEVGQFARPARGAAVGGAEGDGAGGADLAVDLVAHDDLDAEALALVEDRLRGAEPRASRLDADHGRRAAEQFAGYLAGGRGALVGDGRHRGL